MLGMSSCDDITVSPELLVKDRALVPVLVYIGMVVAVVSSLGAPLIPTIARDEHISLANAQWSLTITLLVAAVATPLMGRLGDGPARRPVMLIGLGSVVLGSALAALPPAYAFLIAGRALMGVGLGLLPLTMATARDQLTGERQRSTIALLSISTVAGVGLGYPLTGVIAQVFGLRGAFWFGAIVTGAAFVVALLFLPSARDIRRRPLDGLGALLIALALAALLLALSEAESWGWTSARIVGLSVAGVALLAIWTRHELRSDHPLIDLRLVRHRAVLTADATGLLAGVGMYLLLSLVTRFVQTPTSTGYGFGVSVAIAGLVLLPFSLASISASRLGPMLGRRTSPDLVLPLGFVVFVLAAFSFALFRGHLWEVFVTMTFAGLGVGLTFAAMPGLIVRSVPPHETGSAMSLNQVLRYIGYSIGSALSGTILEAHTAAGKLLPSNAGYTVAAVIGGIVLLLTAVVAFVLPRAGRSSPVDAELALENGADAVPFDPPVLSRQ